MPLTKLNKENLIPSLNARKVLKDRLGFIWVSTQEGLFRFDGTISRAFSQNVANRKFILNGTDIFDLAIDYTGDHLWALSLTGGLTKINISSGTTDTTISLKGVQAWCRSLAVTAGHIFIGSADGTVFRIDKSNYTNEVVFRSAEKLQKPGSINKILLDQRNKLWFLISEVGIVTSDSIFNNWKFLIDESQPSDSEIPAYTDLAANSEYIFIPINTGLKIVDIEKQWYVNIRSVLKGKLLNILNRKFDCITIFGEEAFVTGDGKLLKISFSSGEITELRFSRFMDDDDWLLYTSSIYFDGKALWIGGQYGLAYIRNLDPPVTGYYESMDKSFLRLGHCTTIFHRSENEVYVCTDNGLFRVYLQSGALKRLSDPQTFYSGICLPNNSLLVSGPGGTEFYFGGRKKNLSSVFPELGLLADKGFVSMVTLRDSLYFFAAFNPNEFYAWDRKKRLLHKVDVSSWLGARKGYFTKRLFFDSEEKLWVLFDASITKYNPQTRSSEEMYFLFPNSTDTLNINMDIAETGSYYWIADYGHGLARVSKDNGAIKLYGKKEGFYNVGLNKIVLINDTLLAISSNTGLSIMNVKNESIETFLEEDGMHSNYFEQFSGTSVSDIAIFGGLGGMTAFDAKKMNLRKSRHDVYISSIMVHVRADTTTENFDINQEYFEIPAGALQATVNFSSINYDSPEKFGFAYRIMEVDTNWINIGNSRSINLMGRQPGNYSIEIKYLDGNFSETQSIARVSLNWLPLWYQTLWFRVGVVIFAAGFLYALYRYRISQIKAQQNIRKNMASDLHDDIGSTLNTVKVFTHLAKNSQGDLDFLNKIEDALSQATTGLRDMIWILDDSLDTTEEFLERIKKFALPISLANNITFSSKIEYELKNSILTKKEKRNLLLMAKEAINNSIKYSGCKNIEVLFQKNFKKKVLIIKDDGNGFDTDSPSQGNGIKNLKYRSKNINYKVQIISTIGNGTEITISEI
ncbi:triple tyrosine motif-containing protein [Pollutibacter soli]|uniref:sensor histidine kinase n=1 Tax=Pollutibacter soli TaxID=3034157 RepID=UPI003013C8D6